MEKDFPSGSNWTDKEVLAVRFTAQPNLHEFRTFPCNDKLSDQNKDVPERLSEFFGVPAEDIENDEVLRLVPNRKPFYQSLVHLLERAPAKATPNRPRTRYTKLGKSSSPLHYDESQETPKASTEDAESQETSKDSPCETTSIGSSPPMKKPRMSRGISGSPSPIRHLALPGPVIMSPPRRRDSPQPASGSSSPLSSPPPDSDQSANADDTPPKVFLETHFTSSQTESTYQATSEIASSPSRLPRKRPEVAYVLFYLNLLQRICDDHGNDKEYKFVVDAEERLIIMINGEEISTTPDLTVSIEIKGTGRCIPVIDFEGKPHSEVQGYGQKVSEILGRASEMRNRDAQRPYPVYLLSAEGLNLRLTTVELRHSYLTALNNAPLSTKMPSIPVEEYGPIDLEDHTNRVLAVSTIYKLMLRCADRVIRDQRIKAEDIRRIQDLRSGKSKK